MRELQLLPPEGEEFLDAAELVARLEAEFAYVRTDRDEGLRLLKQGIAFVERWSPVVYEVYGAKGTGEARKQAHLQQMRDALPSACCVTFGDDEQHAVKYPLAPPEGILIVVEEDWQAAIAARCASALGYVLHEI